MKFFLTSVIITGLISSVTALASMAPQTPFEIASAAYNGNLKEQGISSFGGLCDDLHSRAVTSNDVMNAALSSPYD